MKRITIAAYLIFACISLQAQQKMKPLFNGKDLKGWYSFLTTKGKNNDPEKVFVVENGQLHISGKEFGYICTEKVFENFHLAVEFKWGKKKFPPRDADSVKRDNGICYYVPENEKDTVWPKSIECQIQEGDVGDFWMIGHTTIEVDGKRTTADSAYFRMQKKKDAERPTGEWNRVEVISNKGNITYLVNGVKVNEGKIQALQKEKF